DVVLTFGPDGAYGHPDHIAICQLTTTAVAAAASPSEGDPGPHLTKELYYTAWPSAAWAAYEAGFGRVISTVDGEVRQAIAWPVWAITTVIDTRPFWPKGGKGTSWPASPG